MGKRIRRLDKSHTQSAREPTAIPTGAQPLDLNDGTDAHLLDGLLEPAFFMTLSGDWKTGGVVEFLLGEQQLSFIKLSPPPWTVMASLFLAAIQSQLTHWQRAFVPTKRLIELFGAHDHGSFPDDQTVHRHINTIRSKLAATTVRKHAGYAHLTGLQWAKAVVQSSRAMGYSVGLPPGQLRLFIGDAEHKLAMGIDSEVEG